MLQKENHAVSDKFFLNSLTLSTNKKIRNTAFQQIGLKLQLLRSPLNWPQSAKEDSSQIFNGVNS